jgi:hypothetical protein
LAEVRYDVHITSTGNVGLFGFSYASSGVTAARYITLSSNKVTDANPTTPAGKSLNPSGSASPNGW